MSVHSLLAPFTTTSTTSPTRRPSTARPIGELGVTTERNPSPPGPVELDARADRSEEERASLGAVFDLDDGADGDGRLGGEARRPKAVEGRELARRPLEPRPVPAR